MSRLLSIALLLGLLSANSSANYFDGNGLKKLIDGGQPSGEAMFRGYVAAIQDLNNGVSICVDENVRLSQAAAVVQKYFSENPQLWHLAASQLVFNALQRSFPCKK